MKRQYITPSVFCLKLDTRKAFLENVVSNVQISNEYTEEDDACWAREYNSDDSDNTDNNRGNIWDNAW